MGHKFVKAYWPWTWFLRTFKLAGIVMPWRSIYYLNGWANNDEFRRHELVHIEQINRDGPVRFSIRYIYWLIRYGYRDNPYEVEAYNREKCP